MLGMNIRKPRQLAAEARDTGRHFHHGSQKISLQHRLRFSTLQMMPGHSAFASMGASDECALPGASSSARCWLIPRTKFWNFDNRDRSPMRGYKVDLTDIRTEVGGGGNWLNPAAPCWHDHLIQQVGALNDTFGFGVNFLDTQPNLENELRHSPLDGRSTIPDFLSAAVGTDLLLATKIWFNLSRGIIPLSQTSEGPNHWSRHYRRRFAHLSLGELGCGSTGVHELGQMPYDLPTGGSC
jgi:hypothetical protein